MTSRNLHFTKDKATYLLLNIIAHDVIHDYGPAGGTEKRWSDNQQIVKQFTQDYYSFSDPTVGGGKRSRTEAGFTTDEDADNNTNADTSPYSVFHRGIQVNPKTKLSRPNPYLSNDARGISSVTPLFPGQAQTIGYSNEEKFTINYENYINTLNQMDTDINNSIIFTFFNHFLFLTNRGLIGPNINYMSSKSLIVPFGTEDNTDNMVNDNYLDIFGDICNKFIGFCYFNKVNMSLPYADFLNILCVFLSTTFSTSQSIFENTFDILMLTSYGISTGGTKIKNKIKKGGTPSDIQLNFEESQQLIDQINKLNNSGDVIDALNTLNNIYNEYYANEGVLSQQNKQIYEDTRKSLLKQYQEVFLSQPYEQKKKAGSIYGDVDILPIIKVRFSYRKVELIPNFNKKIADMLLDYHKIVAEQVNQQELIERQRLSDELAAQQGDLTSSDKIVRQQFSSFMAKSGLFLLGICNNDGTIIKTITSMPNLDNTLRKEINILLYIAGWTQNPGWQELRNQSLDDELIDHFNKNTIEIQGRYICQGRDVKNYVVNNAAPISSDLKNKSFCPYTSILDGMSQCSWNSAQGNVEYGDMNFKIADTSEDIYYNGVLEIDTQKLQPNVNPTNLNLSYNVRMNGLNITLSGNKSTTMNGLDLEAHFVLKNTLLNVINFILNANPQTQTRIFTGGNIFGNLFDMFSSDKSNYVLFNTVYSEILFKGTGDLFQEINCVCKFGGYTMSNYTINPGILPINTSSGEQLRLFTANDRPSGTRFIYMLKNGNPSEINTKAIGGYYSKEHILIYGRPDNKNICGIVPLRGGGKLKRKTRKHKNYKNVKKNYGKTKKNKTLNMK
jgi:hypothetical protein